MTLRGSDLALLKNQIRSVVVENGTPAEKNYFDLVFEEGLSLEEAALAFDRREGTLAHTLSRVRDKILENKPFLQTPEALKYKGAGRILKLLATQCDRRNEAHDNRDFSYTDLFNAIENIVEEDGTRPQKRVYRKYFVEGKSQTDIGAELGRCQPTIQKTIYGNRDYNYDDKYFGGIIAKVGKGLKEADIPYCCHLIHPYGTLFNFIFSKRVDL